MGYFLDSCPGLNACCYCIPLRVGAFIVAALGLLIGVGFLVAFSPLGVNTLLKYGMPPEYSSVNKYMNGAFGVLFVATHALLVAGAVRQNDVLLEVYIWALIVLWALVAFYEATVLMAYCLVMQYGAALLYLAACYVPLFAWIYAMIVVGAYRLSLP